MNHSLSRALPSTPESKNYRSGHGFARRIRHIAVLVCIVSIGFWPVGSHSLWAQEPSVDQGADSAPSNQQDVDDATVSEPEAPGTPEPEGPVKQPRFLPPRLRPKVLTPEEQEEAERLKRLGAKYGTDPTAIVGRVQLSSQYQDLVQGARAIDTTLRVDVPFRKNWLLRVDTPFLRWSDPDRPGTTSQHGLSDLAVVAGWRAYNTAEYALLLGVISTMPTATETGLGFGKYTIGPTIATARFLPRLDSLLLGLLTHQFSVGGDPSRKPVELSKLTAQVNSFWAERWWTIAQTVWQIDWQRSAKSSMAFEFEVGRSVAGRLGIYVRPGVGIWGRDLIGAYQWNIETGIRYIFPSF
jgi:hypothetical protein